MKLNSRSDSPDAEWRADGLTSSEDDSHLVAHLSPLQRQSSRILLSHSTSLMIELRTTGAFTVPQRGSRRHHNRTTAADRSRVFTTVRFNWL